MGREAVFHSGSGGLGSRLLDNLLCLVAVAASVFGQDPLAAHPYPPLDDRFKGGRLSNDNWAGARGFAVFRGRELHHDVVDGMAVHGGDMVLGPVEGLQGPALPTASTRFKERDATGTPAELRHLSATDADRHWPSGIVPYSIDADIPQSENLAPAIEAWNTTTVITLMERTIEPDFVRFTAVPSDNCRSHVGRVGWNRRFRSRRMAVRSKP